MTIVTDIYVSVKQSGQSVDGEAADQGQTLVSLAGCDQELAFILIIMRIY
jgi:hypothetical protein